VTMTDPGASPFSIRPRIQFCKSPAVTSTGSRPPPWETCRISWRYDVRVFSASWLNSVTVAERLCSPCKRRGGIQCRPAERYGYPRPSGKQVADDPVQQQDTGGGGPQMAVFRADKTLPFKIGDPARIQAVAGQHAVPVQIDALGQPD